MGLCLITSRTGDAQSAALHTRTRALSRVRLRTGRELTVVNISAAGALLEGLTRLLPNTHTDLHIVTRHGRVLVRARVVRAFVWRLERDVVCYRDALAFETAVDTEVEAALNARGESNEPALSERSESNGYQVPGEIPGNISRPGTPYPDSRSKAVSEPRTATCSHRRRSQSRGIEFGICPGRCVALEVEAAVNEVDDCI